MWGGCSTGPDTARAKPRPSRYCWQRLGVEGEWGSIQLEFGSHPKLRYWEESWLNMVGRHRSVQTHTNEHTHTHTHAYTHARLNSIYFSLQGLYFSPLTKRVAEDLDLFVSSCAEAELRDAVRGYRENTQGWGRTVYRPLWATSIERMCPLKDTCGSPRSSRPITTPLKKIT